MKPERPPPVRRTAARGRPAQNPAPGEIPVPLQTVEPRRLYRQIAEQIAGLIAAGEFVRGARLPAERELATLLGVSRTSVREAIISLEIAGLVEVRVGTGIFVTSAPAAPEPGGDKGPGPFELLDARMLIEGEIAALAAACAKETDIAALRQALARMTRARRRLRHPRGDRPRFSPRHRAGHRQRLARAGRRRPVEPADRAVGPDPAALPHRSAGQADAARSRGDTRGGRGTRCRRGEGGDAPPSRPGGARFPAGRDGPAHGQRDAHDGAGAQGSPRGCRRGHEKRLRCDGRTAVRARAGRAE